MAFPSSAGGVASASASVSASASADLGPSQPSSGFSSPYRMHSRSRTQSISSDRPSTIAASLMSPPLSVSPEAAFIATSAASQIVTNDHDSHADSWYDEHGIEPSGETAMVSPSALQLVNKFLDQLLFNFLAAANATTLSALRPAVTEVLKPKLAKDAINQADEELQEYLGGADDDLIQSMEPATSPDWDLELSWKRTRLRCMVYSSLGDMEEEDEDFYMEQENLDTGLEDRVIEVVSPAVAIFLTSILEFMGEQALVVAGQAAYHRMRVKFDKDLKEGLKSPADMADRIVVEELDMERVALDRTLGRLWRSWKKKIRSPALGGGLDQSLLRHYSRDSLRSALGHLRSPSVSAETGVPATVLEPDEGDLDRVSGPARMETEEHGQGGQEKGLGLEQEQEQEQEQQVQSPELLPANIPLPIGPYDVAEIQVPGLVSHEDDNSDGDNKMLGVLSDPQRPKSLMIFSQAAANDLPTPTLSQPHTPILSPRKRSNSLPTPNATPYTSPAARGREETTIDAKMDANGDNRTPAEDGTLAAVDETRAEEVATGQGALSRLEAPAIAIVPSAALEESKVAVAQPRALPVRNHSLAVGAHTKTAHIDDIDEGDEDADEFGEEEEDEEEVQILTSSRISISGRSSGRSASPAASASASEEQGRPHPINTNLPLRSSSVHSLRLIEVTSPRSPGTRSRGSSVDTTERIRAPSSLPYPYSSKTPTERRSPDFTSAPRSAGLLSGKSGLATSESISEAEEADDENEGVSPLTPGDQVPQQGAAPAPSVPSHAKDSAPSPSQAPLPSFGSVNRHASSPPSPGKQAITKVTIVSTSSAPGTFFIEAEPDFSRPPSGSSPSQARPSSPLSPTVPVAAPVPNPPGHASAQGTPPATATTLRSANSQMAAPAPAVPERSPSRQALAAYGAPGSASGPGSGSQQPATIGIVSVDRPHHRSPSEKSVPRAVEQQQNLYSSRPVQPPGNSSPSTTAKLKPVRTSEEAQAQTLTQMAVSRADVARDFEELIQSDQTIQYTLTPEGMRDISANKGSASSSPGPVVPAKVRRSEDTRQYNTDRPRASSLQQRAMELTRSISVSRSTGLNSHPVVDSQANSDTKLSGPVPRSMSAMQALPSKPRANVPQARDARLPRESLSEFADFIRSTGPLGSMSTPVGAMRSVSASASPGASASASASASGPNGAKPSLESGRMSTASSRTRARLQARDAAVDYKDDTSDLIDFIRRGPPSVPGQHRIPRTVAPFRTTMDSDQMSGAISGVMGGQAVDAQMHDLDIRSSAASTNITDYSMPSIQSSINSQSALLSRNRPLPAPGGASRLGGIGGEEDDMAMPMPMRKSRRVRDPYAIDLSDEDDMLEEEATPRSNRRAPPQEESLAEFLRNVPPPPPEPEPALHMTQAQNRPRKKASAPSLLSRFTRRGSEQSGMAGASGNTGVGGRGSSGLMTGSRSLSSRAGSLAGSVRGYIPIQVNLPGSFSSGVANSMGPAGGMNTSGPPAMDGPASKAAAMMGTSTSTTSGRLPMRRFEPRDATSTHSRGTSDLASFLKNSEPPMGGVPGAGPASHGAAYTQDDPSGSSRMFGRRKKSTFA